jgi:hypothetical protein
MADGDLHSGVGAVTKSKDSRFLNMELLQQGCHIICILLKARWAIPVSCMAMRLELYRNDLVVFGKQRLHHSKVGADGRAAAMDEHQRLTRAVDFIIHFKPVYIGVMPGGLDLFLRLCLIRGHYKEI